MLAFLLANPFARYHIYNQTPRFISDFMITITKAEGIRGKIKTEPEDFIVKEITKSGKVLEPGRKYLPEELGEVPVPGSKFTTFILEKKNWDTISALLSIAKKAGRGRKSISYAGVKDKRSISVQLASIYGVTPSSISAINIKDIHINGAWEGSETTLGSNLGNSFSVKLNGFSGGIERIPSIIEESMGRFPNYFDRQRFGYRLNNFSIGMHILHNEMEEAVMSFLTYSGKETDMESREARARLAEERDFQKALDYFPRHLRPERAMIAYLARYRNFHNAIRNLQRGIAIMFIHSVEDAIFNAVLEKRIREGDFESRLGCKANFHGFPDIESVSESKEKTFEVDALIGYETKEEYISDYSKEIMERFGINKDSFKIKSLPELSMKGAYRPILSPFKDFSYTDIVGTSDLNLEFSIPSGSYATIFLNEITKNDNTSISEMLDEPKLL